jgi:hypothetical protein
MSVAFVFAGIGIFVIVAPGLFIRDIRAGLQFEVVAAWCGNSAALRRDVRPIQAKITRLG